jgi:predicted phosphodiesterase
MKRLGIAALVLIVIGVTVAISGGLIGGLGGKTFFPKEERNPVTHLRWNEDDKQFQFVIVSDRTGGHRAQVFSQAVEKINLMQPAFVLSVGDLIEGGKKPEEKLAAEWKEFDGFVNKLEMPFFYVAGNHDAATKESSKFWEEKLGKRYYHFVYRNVLFLILNSNDPPGSVAIGKEQAAWARKVLADNRDVSWTIVAFHHPIWNGAIEKNGFGEIESALKDRNYTVFAGHVHRYEKTVRQGMAHYQLATTGGSSRMRGVDYNEFDHFVWVTMKKEGGPVLANILLDGVHNESIAPIKTDEPGVSTAKRLATYPVKGVAYFEGAPIPGAIITLTTEKAPPGKGVTAVGMVEADGTFKLSTYTAFDGVPAGQYSVTAVWRMEKGAPNLLPAKYATAGKSELQATIKAGPNELKLELKK